MIDAYLTKRIPARTKTIHFNWLNEFALMSDEYRSVRLSMGGTFLCCFWCKTKFETGDQIWLGNVPSGKRSRNRVFCDNCGQEAHANWLEMNNE